MPRNPPEVIQGIKSPDDFPARREDESPVAALARDLPPPPMRAPRQAAPGKVRFMSNISDLKVTRLITRPHVAPATGEYVEEIHHFAQFRQGVYETDDAEMIAFLKGRKNYGPNGDFWDVDELQAVAHEQAEKDWLDRIRSNPELKDKLRVALDSTDFQLSEPPPAK